MPTSHDNEELDPAANGMGMPEEPLPKGTRSPRRSAERRSVLLRLDPAVHDALAHWASDELRSVNAQIEITLRRALADAGRSPQNIQPIRRPGRPRKSNPDDNEGGAD